MSTDVTFTCSCGTLRGVLRDVAPERGNHIGCYCDDCQSFAHFLERADRALDAHGGTEIFQTSAARLAIEDGAQELACLRLRPDGLVRWYARCCKTPIGNTLATRQLPFVGVILGALRWEAPDGASERAFGPIIARANGRFAKGDVSGLDLHDRAPLSLILRFMRILLAARLRGDHRRSVFFDAEGELSREPLVLSAQALAEVEARRDA